MHILSCNRFENVTSISIVNVRKEQEELDNNLNEVIQECLGLNKLVQVHLNVIEAIPSLQKFML